MEEFDFIKQKIREIKVALFRSETSSELQLPNNIINVLKITDDGTVYFYTSCICNQAKNIDKSFYAYLDFHKKGTDCRLQLSGKAIVEENDDGLFHISNYSKETSARLLLVKMKIVQAEYFESKPITDVSWGEKIKAMLNHMFVPAETKVYHFS